VEDSNDVSRSYELDMVTPVGAATLAMAEWHAVLNHGRLASTFMLFDSNASATLLRGALVGLHAEEMRTPAQVGLFPRAAKILGTAANAG
jgi:hypothetical protein